MVTVQGLDLGRPPAPGVEWSVNGDGLTSGGGVTVSDASITFSDVRRSHSGEYSAIVGNVHVNVTADFTVDVTCECSRFAAMTICMEQIKIQIFSCQVPYFLGLQIHDNYRFIPLHKYEECIYKYENNI